MTAWPKDTQAARNAFYGDPAKNEIAGRMVPVVPPFAMYYEGRRIKAIQFHEKAAPALLAALNEIWDACGRDQAKIDAAGVSKYAGAYNHRMVRGSKTKWSNHAYAAAIDLNATENGLHQKGNMPQFVIDAFCRQGAMWGGWYKGRLDPMHFEFVDNGGRKPKNAAPVYGKSLAPIRNVGNDDAPLDEVDDVDPVTPPGPPINIQPPTAPYQVRVETAQRSLDKLGYHEVGEIDGRWGGKTKGALTAFLNDRGNKSIVVNGGLTGPIEDALSDAVDEGWSRPISTARATATAKEVAPKVEVVRQSLIARLWAKATGTIASLFTIGAGAINYFGSVNDQIAPVKEFFASVPGWAWGLVVLAICVGWYLTSDRTAAQGTADYNTGRIN